MRLLASVLCIAVLAACPSRAQTTAAPSGTRINPSQIKIGTTPGTVAGGDALAAFMAQEGQPNGFCPLDANGLVPLARLPVVAAPLQAVAGLTGSPTAAQLAAALGGASGQSLAFGNDSRITGALQPSTVTGLVKSSGTAFAAAGGADIALAGGVASTDSRLPSGPAGSANGSAVLQSGGFVPAAYLVNLPTIAPLTASVGLTPVTVFPAGSFISVKITPLTPGTALACTGDGSTPAIGSSATALYGQRLHWPSTAGGTMPTGAIKCVASAPSTVTTEAH